MAQEINEHKWLGSIKNRNNLLRSFIEFIKRTILTLMFN